MEALDLIILLLVIGIIIGTIIVVYFYVLVPAIVDANTTKAAAASSPSETQITVLLSDVSFKSPNNSTSLKYRSDITSLEFMYNGTLIPVPGMPLTSNSNPVFDQTTGQFSCGTFVVSQAVTAKGPFTLSITDDGKLITRDKDNALAKVILESPKLTETVINQLAPDSIVQSGSASIYLKDGHVHVYVGTDVLYVNKDVISSVLLDKTKGQIKYMGSDNKVIASVPSTEQASGSYTFYINSQGAVYTKDGSRITAYLFSRSSPVRIPNTFEKGTSYVMGIGNKFTLQSDGNLVWYKNDAAVFAIRGGSRGGGIDVKSFKMDKNKWQVLKQDGSRLWELKIDTIESGVEHTMYMTEFGFTFVSATGIKVENWTPPATQTDLDYNNPPT